MLIGSSGTGTLNLSSGALNVNTGSSGGQGRLTIGSGSTYNQSGGTATVREFVSTASATRTFSGGSLNISSSINAANGSAFVVGDGAGATATLNLVNATTTFTNGLTIQSDGVLTGSNVAGTRGAVTVNGTLTPGGTGTAGTFDLATTTTFNASSMVNFELGGTATNQFDRWLSTGAMTFGGTLTVSFINGFSPLEPASFDLFDFTTGTGTFAAINLPSLDPGLTWDTSNLYTTGVITAVPEPSAYALATIGLLAMLVMRARRRRHLG